MSAATTDGTWLDGFIARTESELAELAVRAQLLSNELDAVEADMTALSDALYALGSKPAPGLARATQREPKRQRPRTVSEERFAQIRAYIHEHFTPDDDVTVAGLSQIVSPTPARIALDRLRADGEMRIVREGGPGRAAAWRLMPS